MGVSARTGVRIDACGGVTATVESVVCDRCQDVCWHIEVWGIDVAGSGERVCVFYRDHLGSQSSAIRGMGSWMLGAAREVEGVEAARYVLEHQQTLW